MTLSLSTNRLAKGLTVNLSSYALIRVGFMSMLLVATPLSAEISGAYITPLSPAGHKASIRIFACATSPGFCALIEAIQGSSPARQVGQTLFENLEVGDKPTAGSRMWDLDTGAIRPGKLEGLGAHGLKITTCVAGGMICRSQTWTRR